MTQCHHPVIPQQACAPTRHEPVFLLTPARSYSTVTVAILAGHPDIYGFPEMSLFTSGVVGELLFTGFGAEQPRPSWFLRSGILRAVADLREESQEKDAIRRAEEWLAERSAWSTRQLMDFLLELAYPKIGLEKSPGTVSSEQALDACIGSYPNARYIHLTRHPIGTIQSMLDHVQPHCPADGKLVVRAASSWYLSHARIIRRVSQLPPRQWIRIRAEDLLREPVRYLPQLLNWLGLPSDSGIISEMTHTESWQFAGTGPSGKLFGGDRKFLLSPALRPVPAPPEVVFDESWELPGEARARITALARQLGY